MPERGNAMPMIPPDSPPVGAWKDLLDLNRIL